MVPNEPSAKPSVMLALSSVTATASWSPMRRACTETISESARKRIRSMKWQASPMMRPPPLARSCVQCWAGMAPAFMVMMNDFGSFNCDSSAFILATCGAKRRLKPTIRCAAWPVACADV